MKKRVCVLYTGGTIGMVPTELGYAPKKKYFSSLLDEISQLKNKDMPNWDVVEFDPLLDSANVAVEQWVNIGREIRDRYHMYDGFVVLHGPTPWPIPLPRFRSCLRVLTNRSF